jgi:hypothetical protein
MMTYAVDENYLNYEVTVVSWYEDVDGSRSEIKDVEDAFTDLPIMGMEEKGLFHVVFHDGGQLEGIGIRMPLEIVYYYRDENNIMQYESLWNDEIGKLMEEYGRVTLLEGDDVCVEVEVNDGKADVFLINTNSKGQKLVYLATLACRQ